MKRTWLIGALVILAGGLSVSCGDDSGDSGGDEESKTRRRVAEALTEGIQFEGGTVELKPMPATTDKDLVIEQDDAPIELVPGVAQLLPFDIENNDEDDEVVATLLQFEGADDDQHVEVTLDLEGGQTMAELTLNVDDSVCDTLCADSFAVKLIQALKTRGGRIGQRITRTLMLTCEQNGSDAMCESGDGDGDGDGDTNGDGDGDVDSNPALDQFRSRAAMLNSRLCRQCNNNVNCNRNQWITQAEIECLDAVVTGNPSIIEGSFTALSNALSSVTTCEAASVFAEAAQISEVQELPEAILACDEGMDTFYAAGGEDVPAP